MQWSYIGLDCSFQDGERSGTTIYSWLVIIGGEVTL